MEKKDCLIAVFENCKGVDGVKLLREARIKARKLIILTKCPKPTDAFPIVKAVADNNMDFPVRHYHGAEPADAAALEKCATYEVMAVE